MLLTYSDTKRTLMHLFLFTNFAHERTGFNMYAEYTQLQLTFLALQPCVMHYNRCTANTILLNYNLTIFAYSVYAQYILPTKDETPKKM